MIEFYGIPCMPGCGDDLGNDEGQALNLGTNVSQTDWRHP